jgi:M6 family metalloprotease-like protein
MKKLNLKAIVAALVGVSVLLGAGVFYLQQSGTSGAGESTEAVEEASLDPETLITPVNELSAVEACRVPSPPNYESATRSGFPLHPDYVLNGKKAVVQLVYVDAEDVVGSKPPAEDFPYWEDNAGGFIRDMSNGTVELEWRFENEYLRLPKPLSDFNITRSGGGDVYGFYQLALDLADPTVDFSDVDIVLVLFPPNVDAIQVDFSPSFAETRSEGFKTDEGSIYRGAILGADARYENGYLLAVHEMGHMFGLEDYYSFEWTESGTTFEDQFRFTGQFDNLGYAYGKSPEWFGWSRWIIDFIGDSQVRCVTDQEVTTHFLRAVSSGSADSMIVVVPTGKFTAVVVESRRSTRHDQRAPERTNGLLVYEVNTKNVNGYGPVRVVRKENSVDKLAEDAPLQLGQSVTLGDIVITNIESGLDWDVAEVRRN